MEEKQNLSSPGEETAPEAEINEETAENNETKEEKKSPLMAVLIGVTAAIVVAVGVIGLVLAGKLFGFGPFASSASSENCPELIGKMYNEVITDEARAAAVKLMK